MVKLPKAIPTSCHIRPSVMMATQINPKSIAEFFQFAWKALSLRHTHSVEKHHLRQ